jgi:hypothetical protein
MGAAVFKMALRSRRWKETLHINAQLFIVLTNAIAKLSSNFSL